MIQYADHESENDRLPLVSGNDNGFAIPIFDDTSNSNDQSGIYNSKTIFISVEITTRFTYYKKWLFGVVALAIIKPLSCRHFAQLCSMVVGVNLAQLFIFKYFFASFIPFIT